MPTMHSTPCPSSCSPASGRWNIETADAIGEVLWSRLSTPTGKILNKWNINWAVNRGAGWRTFSATLKSESAAQEFYMAKCVAVAQAVSS